MKKTMAILLTLVVLVMCMATTAFAAEVGETVQVPITVSGNPGFGSYTVDLSYDSTALKLVSLSNAGNLGSNVGAFMPSVATNRASYFTTTQVKVEGDGTLFVATFEVLDGAQAKTYNIGASFIAGSDEMGTAITLSVAGGSVTVTCTHNYVAGTVTAPTCTEDGYTTYTCSKCGDSYTADTVAALGHDMQQTAAAVAPTCTVDGKTAVEKCSRCGHTTGGEVVPALGHTPKEAVKENEVAATCTTEGSYDEVVYCSVCGEKISSTTKTVPALGHTPKEAVKENEVAATCTTDGSYDEVVYCSVCEEELSRTPKTIPAAHTPGAAVRENEVKGDCQTKHSYDEVVYCSVCKEELSRTKVTGELGGHNYGTDGKCTICGKVKDPNLDNQPDTGDIFVEIALYASFAALAVGAVVFAKRKVRG